MRKTMLATVLSGPLCVAMHMGCSRPPVSEPTACDQTSTYTIVAPDYQGRLAGRLTRYRVQPGADAQPLAFAESAYQVASGPDGLLAVVISDPLECVILKGEQVLARRAIRSNMVAWSADGQALAFEEASATSTLYVPDAELVITDAQLREQRRFPLHADFSTGVSWSRDGRYIALTSRSSPESHSELTSLIVSTDSGAIVEIPHGDLYFIDAVAVVYTDIRPTSGTPVQGWDTFVVYGADFDGGGLVSRKKLLSGFQTAGSNPALRVFAVREVQYRLLGAFPLNVALFTGDGCTVGENFGYLGGLDTFAIERD